MNFDLDYEIDGILYCVSVKASAHDDYEITNIERYLPANNRRTEILNEDEMTYIYVDLIFDNEFVDMVSEQYLSKLQDEDV